MVSGTTPGQVVLGAVRNASKHESKEQASMQISFMASASVPASRFLL